MAIVVLSPQDCLQSVHNRQNSYLSSARSKTSRRCLNAVMVPSSVPQDTARGSNTGGSPSDDGILPVPLVPRKARVLSKRTLPSKVPSTSAFAAIPGMFHESYSPSVKSKLIRSASAILPTPSVGSPPLERGPLNGRFPFKVVQGNRSVNNIDRFQAGLSKKANDQRHRVGKRSVVPRNHVSNLTAAAKLERSKSTPRAFHDDGAVFRGRPKETLARMDDKSERNSSMRGARETEPVKTDFPGVTILQRPKTDDAALKLLTKFFQSRMQRERSQTIERMELMPENLGGSCATVEEKETELDFNDVEFSQFDSTEVRARKVAFIESPHCSKSGAELQKNVEECALSEAGNVPAAFAVRSHSHVDPLPLLISKARIWEADGEDLAPWERWAGPSYVNSPPPSALPLPRFPKKPMEVVPLGDGCLEQYENVLSEQMTSPPGSLSPLYISLARQQHLNIKTDAVATATKDLKRMLNLDLCRV